MASVEEADKMGKTVDKIVEKYNKKLPHRLGITYEVGARLEAQDYLLKWYPSRIEKVDPDEGKILIHFERWNHRYDEWIDCTSPRLRPLQRTSLRREGLKQDEPTVGAVAFKIGDEVLARWIDCRYYPAKIITINKDDTYSVRFYDGFVKGVKSINVKEMPEDLKNQDWTAIVKSTVEAQALEQAANKSRARVLQQAGQQTGHQPAQQPGQQAAHVEEESARKGRCSDGEDGSGSEKVLPQPQKQRSAEARQPTSLLQSKVMAAKKRKSALMGAFQAKRARLNQLTGILASKLSRRRDADGHEAKLQEGPSEAVESKETTQLNSGQPSGLSVESTSGATPGAITRQHSLRLRRSGRASAGLASPSSDSSHSPRSNQHAGSPGQLSSPDRGLSPASATSDSPGRRRRSSALSESNTHDRSQARSEGASVDASSSLKSEMLSADAKRRERDRSKDKKEKDVSKSKKKKKKKKKTRKESTDGASVADSVDSLSLGLEETSGNADDSQDDEGAGGDEIVRCSCGINEETGFMIQCEMCSCWQHSVCMGFTEENIPDRYSCHVCHDPPAGQRWSARFAFERDWLVEGRLQSFSFVRDSYCSRHAASFAALQRLLADMHRVHEVIHGLKLKIHIANTGDNPDLMLWASPWRTTERIKAEATSPVENDSRPEARPPSSANAGDALIAGQESVNGVDSSQVSSGTDAKRDIKAGSPSESTYITSEHCYQKPQGAGPTGARAANARAWREFAGRDGDSGSDTTYPADSGRTNTAGSFIYGLDATYCSAALAGNCENNGGGSSSDETPSGEAGAGSGMEEEGGPSLGAEGAHSGPGWGSTGQQQGGGGMAQQHLCLSELLLHVEALQDDVAKRMDFVEEQLTTLEGMFEPTREQSSEFEQRLPRVKRSLRQMAADLQKLQQLSTLCS